MKGIISEITENIKTGESEFGKWSMSILVVAGKKYSTFDLKDYDCKVGDLIEFDMKERDGKLGIVKGTLKVLEEGIGEPPQDTIPKEYSSRGAYDKDPVGLVVEIFLGLLAQYTDHDVHTAKDIMKDSIDLVKQAQLAFKE